MYLEDKFCIKVHFRQWKDLKIINLNKDDVLKILDVGSYESSGTSYNYYANLEIIECYVNHDEISNYGMMLFNS